LEIVCVRIEKGKYIYLKGNNFMVVDTFLCNKELIEAVVERKRVVNWL